MPEVIDNLNKRETLGIVAPRFVFPHVISDSENVIKGAPFEESEEDSTLLTDFKRKVNALDIQQSEKDALIKRARTALIEQVGPAYTSLINSLRTLEKSATTDDGVWKFPDGEAFYNAALRKTTTTDLTAALEASHVVRNPISFCDDPLEIWRISTDRRCDECLNVIGLVLVPFSRRQNPSPVK